MRGIGDRLCRLAAAVAAFLISAIIPVAASCLARGDAASVSLGVLAPFFALNLHTGARRACREKLELLRQRAELERTAAELETALLMTQRAEAARTRFLATVSHELRTPLNAIVGFADLMQSEAMGPLGSHHYRDYVTISAKAHGACAGWSMKSSPLPGSMRRSTAARAR